MRNALKMSVKTDRNFLMSSGTYSLKHTEIKPVLKTSISKETDRVMFNTDAENDKVNKEQNLRNGIQYSRNAVKNGRTIKNRRDQGVLQNPKPKCNSRWGVTLKEEKISTTTSE